MRLHTILALSAALVLSACGDKDTEDTGDTSSDTGDTDTDTDDTGDTETDGYAFAGDDASAYVRVDRAGMPAVNTALITSKDAYNAADPADDAALSFAIEIITNLGGLHAALDDDLAALGLTPCTVNGDGSGSCVAQGGPLILPDTLKIDLTGSAGFPNGRLAADPVMDVTLAVVLLDLSVHAPDTLVGVNPTANDVAFEASFPFLAPAH